MILVTGGAGFIGSYLVKFLNEKGHNDIIIVDRFKSDQTWRNLSDLKYTDIIHADDLFLLENQDIFKKIKVLFHMGACSSTTENNVDYLLKNNFEYSKKLYEQSVKYDFKFIYASSAATYGGIESNFIDNHENIDNLRPLNPYGWSKQIFDQWLLSQVKKPKHWCGLKFFNVFGPNEYYKGHMSSVAFKAFNQINDTGNVKLFKSHRTDFEDGEQLRDFVYVKDVARVMYELMNLNECSEIFNVGTGKERSFKDLVNSVYNSINGNFKDDLIEYIDMPESIRDQYQYYTCADVSKLKKYLPDFEFMTLESSINDYVKNHLMKRD